MSDSTIAFRAGAELKSTLEEVARARRLGNVSELLREICLRFVATHYENRNDANACKQRELDLRRDKTCPLFILVRSEACAHCGYREQPVVSSEDTPVSDEASKMIGDLFGEDTKKT